MDGEVKDLAPWEVPPDESYWQALLSEGEYDPGRAAPEEGSDPCTDAEQEVLLSQQAADLDPSQSLSGLTSGDPDVWHTFIEYQAQERLIELPVVGYNRGGLLVLWDGIEGFVPASQLCEGAPYGDEHMRQDWLAAQVESSLTLKVIEVEPAQNRLILSEKAAKRTQPTDLSVLDRLKAGDVCSGRVTNLCAFGAFVDLGGMEGLIHISELSWGRVSHPSDMLHSGQEVKVYVLNVDLERGRIGLSIKRLGPDPWETVDSRFTVGQVVEGMVTNVVNFGAFVRLEEGLEGLIHVSELSGPDSPMQWPINEGDSVQVCIMSIDKSRHRMGLSLETSYPAGA
jgi:small subunit ribosomal protein S1